MARHLGNAVVVFFDLETSGLQPNCDILQIGMKSGHAEFNRYVQPIGPIHPSATNVHGLTNENGMLCRYGQVVPTSPMQQVLQDLLIFLQSFNKPCILMGHNSFKFDAPRFVRAINICQLQSAFRQVVHSFADSLVLFRQLHAQGKPYAGQFKLTTLADQLLGLNTDSAHDALFDAHLVEMLVCEFFDDNTILRNIRSFDSFN